MNSRRDFIKATSLLGAGIGIMPNLAFCINENRGKEKLKVGLIGLDLRGTNHLENLLKNHSTTQAAHKGVTN